MNPEELTSPALDPRLSAAEGRFIELLGVCGLLFFGVGRARHGWTLRFVRADGAAAECLDVPRGKLSNFTRKTVRNLPRK